MIIAGMGCAFLAEHMSFSSELKMRPLVEPQITRSISLVTVRGRRHPPVVALFCDLCRQLSWDLHEN
ncbi:MAG: LysR family transcriptional regulator substrate-binding protein [Granulosicoccus sp.]